MIVKIVGMVVVISLAASANAGDLFSSPHVSEPCEFFAMNDWKCLAYVAQKPIPSFRDLDDMASPEWRTRENKFRTIQIARAMLEARHAGFLAGQKSPTGEDPIQPVQPNFMDGAP